MRIVVFGAGAVGCSFAGTLAAKGADVTLVARGETARAIAAEGLTMSTPDSRRTVRLKLAKPGEAVEADLVILALKAYGIARALPQIAPLLRADTPVVTAANGIPWWYFHRHGGKLEGTHLASVDPAGRIWKALGPERAVGIVLYVASEIVAPAHVRQMEHMRLPLGEPSGEETPRLARIRALLEDAGLHAPVTRDIRKEIWQKLLGNVSTNPVSALTHATMDVLLGTPETLRLIETMMAESMDAGRALGIRFDMDIPERIAVAKTLGAFRTSMLQDVELGRKMEIEEILGAVSECGRLTGTPTPMIDLVAAMLRQKEAFFTPSLRPQALPA